MNDRELLELAAKAADKKLGQYVDGWQYSSDGPRGEGVYKVDRSQSPIGNPRLTFIFWNPLTYDGDALRLAVKLKIEVRYSIRVSAYACGFLLAIEDIERDQYAGTRRAIVRAAAEIAKMDGK